MSHPQRLLEVTINSAHDLPPMANMLRTFVVAWVNPDNKLSTRVDRNGHTNPTWNDKLLFRVDDDFLRSDNSAVMMVIYNLAWLRDLPMGTTNITVGQILKSLPHKNQASRNITLHIRRPTGHLQGTLNVSVNIVEYPFPPSSPQPQLPSVSKTPSKEFNQLKQETLSEKFVILELESKLELENKIIQDKFSRRNSSRTNSTKDTEISNIVDSTKWTQTDTKSRKSRATSSDDSLFPTLKPLPLEVASDNTKRYYYVSPGRSTWTRSNNIFENWTEAESSEINDLRSKDSRWGVEQQLKELLANKQNINGEKQKVNKKKPSNGKGLFSCFGNVNGFQWKIFCGGSRTGRKKKKNKYESKDPILTSTEQSLHMFKF